MHPLYGAISVPYMPVLLRAVLWSLICIPVRLLDPEPRSTVGFVFPFQYLCVPILKNL